MAFIDIFPVIVLYKDRLESCNTYKTLLSKHSECRYMIYDNSPSPIYKTEELSRNVVYIHDKNNGGVTAAYNKGAEYAYGNGYKWVLLLDQDTSFEENYITELERSMEQYKDVKVFVPQIYYNENVPFSPSIYKYGIGKGVKLNAGIHSLCDMLPVNSGTCINVESFQSVNGYNKNIRLDFADIDFFTRLSRIENKFCLTGSNAYQSFSNNETNINKLYARYVIYINDAKQVKFNGIRKRIFHSYGVFHHTVALTVKSKCMKFIRHFICHYIF